MSPFIQNNKWMKRWMKQFMSDSDSLKGDYIGFNSFVFLGVHSTFKCFHIPALCPETRYTSWRVPWSALELAEGVCYPEARLVCGAWLSFGRGKRGRFHPQNFAKTCHFTRSDSSRFAFWLVEFTRFWRCDSSWTSLSSHTGLALTVHTSEPSRLNNTVFEALLYNLHCSWLPVLCLASDGSAYWG
jgi:hypothetical protein